MRTRPFEILLVEDNYGDVVLLKEALTHSEIDHHLQVVRDGQSALDLVFACNGHPRCPDLIILDLNLPKVDGYKVLQVIKQDERTRAVPIIVMSSSGDRDDIQRAYEFHANSYIRKPGDLEDLFRVVLAVETFWFAAAELPERVKTKPA